jgi:hypothetical protein
VSDQAVSDQAMPDQYKGESPSEGGRACPVPSNPSLHVLHGPFGTPKPQRTFASTGVITADLLGRTFV